MNNMWSLSTKHAKTSPKGKAISGVIWVVAFMVGATITGHVFGQPMLKLGEYLYSIISSPPQGEVKWILKAVRSVVNGMPQCDYTEMVISVLNAEWKLTGKEITIAVPDVNTRWDTFKNYMQHSWKTLTANIEYYLPALWWKAYPDDVWGFPVRVIYPDQGTPMQKPPEWCGSYQDPVAVVHPSWIDTTGPGQYVGWGLAWEPEKTRYK